MSAERHRGRDARAAGDYQRQESTKFVNKCTCAYIRSRTCARCMYIKRVLELNAGPYSSVRRAVIIRGNTSGLSRRVVGPGSGDEVRGARLSHALGPTFRLVR